MTLRIHTERGSERASGYLMVEVPPEDHSGTRPRYVAVHRLVATAHGLLDGLDDPREVHHLDGCPVHNSVANLDSMDPREHGRLTRQQAEERRRSA